MRKLGPRKSQTGPKLFQSPPKSEVGCRRTGSKWFVTGSEQKSSTVLLQMRKAPCPSWSAEMATCRFDAVAVVPASALDLVLAHFCGTSLLPKLVRSWPVRFARGLVRFARCGRCGTSGASWCGGCPRGRRGRVLPSAGGVAKDRRASRLGLRGVASSKSGSLNSTLLTLSFVVVVVLQNDDYRNNVCVSV